MTPRTSSRPAPPVAAVLACALLLLVGGDAAAQDARGTLTANGQPVALRHALAQEVDSGTEKGYMDVVVVLSDRRLQPADAMNPERLEAMARRDGLAALVVRLNPDAKVLSAAPLHPAFGTFLRSAAFIRWQPGAFDEKRVAGRFSTDGPQAAFGQRWDIDVTFDAPIVLDPAAQTAPRR